MELHIDTSEYGKAVFEIKQAGKKPFKKLFKILPHQSFEILPSVAEFLKKSKILQSEIKKIVVYKGGGSFTGLRVGFAIAQGLSLVWGVPILTKKSPK